MWTIFNSPKLSCLQSTTLHSSPLRVIWWILSTWDHAWLLTFLFFLVLFGYCQKRNTIFRAITRIFLICTATYWEYLIGFRFTTGLVSRAYRALSDFGLRSRMLASFARQGSALWLVQISNQSQTMNRFLSPIRIFNTDYLYYGPNTQNTKQYLRYRRGIYSSASDESPYINSSITSQVDVTPFVLVQFFPKLRNLSPVDSYVQAKAASVSFLFQLDFEL